MPITAKDKVVIITGGAGEIGSALARRLVDEGAKVVLADVKDGSSLERDLKSRGEARFIQTDVGSEEQTRRLADETEKAYGRIDVLINNAGLFTACPWDQLTYDEWTTRMRVNVDGTFLATKAVVPAMRRQG